MSLRYLLIVLTLHVVTCTPIGTTSRVERTIVTGVSSGAGNVEYNGVSALDSNSKSSQSSSKKLSKKLQEKLKLGRSSSASKSRDHSSASTMDIDAITMPEISSDASSKSARSSMSIGATSRSTSGFSSDVGAVSMNDSFSKSTSSKSRGSKSRSSSRSKSLRSQSSSKSDAASVTSNLDPEMLAIIGDNGHTRISETRKTVTKTTYLLK